tara:strand:- start:308 stop:880 length:573 start_codon:yes stop_codon:yes gene_type:complete
MTLLYCIRHGYSLHNDLFKKIGEKAYRLPECTDSYLLKSGIEDAMNFNLKYFSKLQNVDLVLVSPLTRALQTADICFTGLNVPVIVLDILKEWPNGLDTPNYRKNKSELKNRFSKFNFDYIKSEEDDNWNKEREETIDELKIRINSFENFIRERKEMKICVIGHTSFLSTMIWGEEKNMEHCRIYEKLVN